MDSQYQTTRTEEEKPKGQAWGCQPKLSQLHDLPSGALEWLVHAIHNHSKAGFRVAATVPVLLGLVIKFIFLAAGSEHCKLFTFFLVTFPLLLEVFCSHISLNKKINK